MAHSHSVYDSDTHFTINSVTRQIRNETSRKTTLIQGDHNSERFTFELPRYIEKHDMSLCNKVEVHYLNIDSETKEQNSGLYTVDDLKISTEDSEKVTCSWLISENATRLVGGLYFIVRFCCEADGFITYAWNTAVCKDIAVSTGINAAATFETEYVDIIEQWKESVVQGFADDLKAEAKKAAADYYAELNAGLAVERARIDNQLSGATADDAELQDIRVGANGVTYDSAGTAVRAQILDTSKKLSVLGDFEKDTSGWKPVNTIEGFSWGEAGYTYDNYGNLVSTEYTKQFTPLTELVPAVSGASYQASGFIGQIRIYNADKTQLDLLYNNAMANQLSFTAPDGACYFGIYYRHDVLTTEEMVAAIKILRTTMTAEEYSACPAVLNNSRICDKPLLGKTVVNFGDSIFGNARTPEDISTYIATQTGATVYNCGFGGCRMSYHPSANYDAFSMSKLADAIANNDYTVQDMAIANTDGDGLPGYFAEAVELLKNIDFNDVDIITIAYGANDFNGVILDDTNNKLNTRTFAGALRYSIETVLSAYPNIRVFVCSPTYRFWMDSNYSFIEDSDTKIGGASYRTTDIVKKAEDVAAEYKLPYIDNYYVLGINKFNRTQYFPKTDGAHHNINGRKLIAAHIAKELF